MSYYFICTLVRLGNRVVQLKAQLLDYEDSRQRNGKCGEAESNSLRLVPVPTAVQDLERKP